MTLTCNVKPARRCFYNNMTISAIKTRPETFFYDEKGKATSTSMINAILINLDVYSKNRRESNSRLILTCQI